MKERLTIYVSSPRDYKDVFDIFYKCYQKFWFDSRYPIVLSTNYEAIYEGVKVINSENLFDTWTERTIGALHSIDSEYILLLCDDLFIQNKIDNDDISAILDIMDNFHIDYCRLNPFKRGYQFYEGKLLLKAYKKIPYALNLQRGIFRKEYLQFILGDGKKSAWDLENQWLQKSMNASDGYFDNIAVITKDVIPVIHAVQKGLFYPSVKKKLNRLGVCIEGERQYMSVYTQNIQRLKEIIGNDILNPRMRYFCKKILSKFGFSFTSKY